MSGMGGDAQDGNETVSFIGVANADGAVLGCFEHIHGPQAVVDVLEGFALSGVRAAQREHDLLGAWMALDRSSRLAQSKKAGKPLLVGLVEAFLARPSAMGEKEAQRAHKDDRPSLAALARLVCSVEAVTGHAWWDQGAERKLEEFTADMLLPPQWEFSSKEAGDAAPACQAWIMDDGSGYACLRVEAQALPSAMASARRANELCAPLFPIVAGLGHCGAELRSDVGLASRSAVAAALLGCSWSMPWASSEMAIKTPKPDEETASMLWLDAIDARNMAKKDNRPWESSPRRALALDAFGLRQGLGWKPNLIQDSMGLAIGVNVGVRLALGSEPRLANLGVSTLEGWALKAEVGVVAKAIESVMSAANRRGAPCFALAPVLARIQAQEMRSESELSSMERGASSPRRRI
jgi:hypothetical protein